MPILHWLNDEEARKKSSQIPYRLLEADNDLSFGDSNSENMLFQGDNLEALKALLPYYAGQIKCIFIDPPYNTRSAFEHYDDNLEHSIWLSTMYPRLEMLRHLLSEDGSIWISIDDNEGHYLKVVMDEVFGRKNFISNVIWQKKYSPQNDAKWLSDSHDHILVFARDKSVWHPFLLPRTTEMNLRYKNPDNDFRGNWKPADLSAKTYNTNTDYEIITPSGRSVYPPESRSWIYTKDKLQELIADNRIWFGKTGNNVPSLKIFLSEVQQGAVSKTIWLREEVGDNEQAKKEIKILNENESFATPKPERLIQRILQLSTLPNDIVLDSFLGSGTTAAVAHKMGRRYIGIEMGEHAITHCIPRMKKVVEGEQGGISKDVNWQGGGGFTFYHLGETVFDEQGQINTKVKFKTLAAHVWFSETHTPLSKTPETPLLGVHNETALYLLFNGILGDITQEGGNVLTARILRQLPKHEGKKVIYGEMCMLDETSLLKQEITFKHIPYDIKAR
jgi:adenine-specific DNA-methyltransferase